MTRTQALERIAQVLVEKDELEAEWDAMKKSFKTRREQLETDLRMCRADVDQMRLDEGE